MATLVGGAWAASSQARVARFSHSLCLRQAVRVVAREPITVLALTPVVDTRRKTSRSTLLREIKVRFTFTSVGLSLETSMP